MHTIFIVDDEKTTRSGLINMIDWTKLDAEIVGEAEDGSTALPLIQELRPEILLTDVKMPFMDGITLANKTKEFCPDIGIVFISGYDDLDYVRSALKIGAFDYLLKPIEIGELEFCITKIIGRLNGEIQRKNYIQELEQKTSLGLPLLKEQFLDYLVSSENYDDKRIIEQMNLLRVRLEGKRYASVVAALDDMALFSRECHEGWIRIKKSVQGAAEEIAGQYFDGYLVGVLRQQFVILLSGVSDEAKLLQMAAELRERLNREQMSVSFGIGPITDSLTEIGRSFRSAEEALRHRIYLGRNKIIPYNSPLIVPCAEKPDASAQTGQNCSLPNLMLQDADEAVVNWIDQFFARLAGKRSTDSAYYRGKISRVVYDIFSLLQEYLPGNDEEELFPQSIIDKLYEMETLQQMREIVQSYCSDVRNLIRLRDDANTKKSIARVKKAIQDRFAENLSIASLAQDVYLTPTYLCLLFRQETGMTINSYITSVRMENAKRLLADMKYKLYDVSLAVGYSNPSYFSRLFKKHTGLLPSEYRERHG